MGFHHDSLAVASSLEAPRVARSWLRERFDEWGVPAPRRDDCLLVASELVTNALRHARPPIGVELACEDDVLRLSVSDGSSAHPRTTDAGLGDLGGRGLSISTLLCDSLSLELVPEDGKRIHAVWSSTAVQP